MNITTENNIRLCVADSPIHGQGLFANCFIEEGAVLGTIRATRTDEDSMYTLWLDDGHGVLMLCEFRYINHSDEPNVVLYDTLEVCALRDIEPGEEITHDYTCADFQGEAG